MYYTLFREQQNQRVFDQYQEPFQEKRYKEKTRAFISLHPTTVNKEKNANMYFLRPPLLECLAYCPRRFTTKSGGRGGGGQYSQ